jgi:hypothetical protein
MLIAHGANPTLINNNGQKPAQVAKSKELRGIIENAVLGMCGGGRKEGGGIITI